MASFDRYLPLHISTTFILIIGGFTASKALQQQSEDIQVIFLPSTSSMNVQDDQIPMKFTAFGQSIELKLHRNRRLVAPNFQVLRHDREIVDLPELRDPPLCHYIHSDSKSTAAVSLCEEDVVNGLVFLDNAALEITPMREHRKNSMTNLSAEINNDKRDKTIGSALSSSISKNAHFVKRSYLSFGASKNRHGYLDQYYKDKHNNNNNNDDRYASNNIAKKLMTLIDDKNNRKRPDSSLSSLFMKRTNRWRHQQQNNAEKEITLELGVFFDEPAYKLFSPFFDENEKKIRDMLLAYVNGVQALYHHPSLGVKIDVVLVRLEIMKSQPHDLPHYGGHRERLLNSFCRYSADNNPNDDDDPDHWDIGLYVSALDFYAYDNDGRRNGVTMGLAPVNGVCHQQYSCVIAELGVTNRFGKPYPSAGFTSIYIAAHEIGHNLGMRHDSSDNSCTKDGFIMSSSRGTRGETTWSPCSRDIALRLYSEKSCLRDNDRDDENDPSLDHGRHQDSPGREWTSKRQCEFLLRDKDATIVAQSDVCQALQCSSPHRGGYHFAGPALEGTICARGRECRGGECRLIPQPSPIPPGTTSSGGNKDENEDDNKIEPPIKCKSGCIVDSKGVSTLDDLLLCNDDDICRKRMKPTIFAAKRCHDYGKRLEDIDSNGGGLQAPHENSIPWMSCALFCRRNDIASFYAPRSELHDLGLDPYFPDGTWCHRENDLDYFCLRHHCLPENFRFNKDSLSSFVINEIDIHEKSFTTENPPELIPGWNDDNDAWIDKDYIELPEDPDRRSRSTGK